jgi:hypothetical protein
MKALRIVLVSLLALAAGGAFALIAVVGSGLLGGEQVSAEGTPTLLYVLDTPGESVAVGDVDGDGKADIAVGAFTEDVDGNQAQGRAYIFSGADGSLLLTLDTPNPQTDAWFGASVAVGDVNADGKTDIAVGAPNEDVGSTPGQGRAYVFSGTDGSLLFTLDAPNPRPSGWFGNALAVGDVNGDGKADVATGVAAQRQVYVFSGADGSLLLTLVAPNPEAYAFSTSVAMGDVNGDAKADIAVGARAEDVGGIEKVGRAYVFSGADGSLLLTLDNPNPQELSWFSHSLAMGDVNGNGKADIAVGARAEDVGGNDWQGRAYVFSGDDGSLLFTLDTPNPQAYAYFGESVAVGDLNGDGKADITVGASGSDLVPP